MSKNKEVNRLIFIVGIILIILTLIAIKVANAEKPVKYGYFVYISGNSQSKRIYVETVNKVTETVKLHYPNHCISDIETALKISRFYCYEDEIKYIYIELKKINSNGKYRRISNKQWFKL